MNVVEKKWRELVELHRDKKMKDLKKDEKKRGRKGDAEKNKKGRR